MKRRHRQTKPARLKNNAFKDLVSALPVPLPTSITCTQLFTMSHAPIRSIATPVLADRSIFRWDDLLARSGTRSTPMHSSHTRAPSTSAPPRTSAAAASPTTPPPHCGTTARSPRTCCSPTSRPAPTAARCSTATGQSTSRARARCTSSCAGTRGRWSATSWSSSTAGTSTRRRSTRLWALRICAAARSGVSS
ncbi:hypothetical protein MPH_00226 [Macrophomina phaseolina MS6]|uniref:Uncharacterized protein n=1 Tax=Macrophomina phaseolina (strain MS6) TaxID=1126212 RepID=K2RIU9_MACPH|nr:hypothetical protein MPH_00226 [Macrophomina phaseolina MS6]